MFTADGVDVSAYGQGDFDWSVTAGCCSNRFGAARISHGAYSAPTIPVPMDQWDPATNPLRTYPGFIDSKAAASRNGMLSAGIGRRVWYTVITPLETAQAQAERTIRWVGLNGGLPPGESVVIDRESNPWDASEYAGIDVVLELWQILAAAYGPDRVGFYGSRGFIDELPDARGFRWLASYTTDARAAAVERGCAVVQWTSSFDCPGWGGRLDMNEVVDSAALDRACGIEVVVVGVPQGALDLVQPVYVEGRWTGEIRYSGWAYDPDTPERQIDVQIVLNGVLCGVLPANRSRTDVNAALGIPGDHGYDGIVTVTQASVVAQVLGVDSSGSGPVAVDTKASMVPLTDATAPPVDPIPPVEPPVDPPVGTVDDAHIEDIARTVARDEISRAHLAPGA